MRLKNRQVRKWRFEMATRFRCKLEGFTSFNAEEMVEHIEKAHGIIYRPVENPIKNRQEQNRRLEEWVHWWRDNIETTNIPLIQEGLQPEK